MIGVRRLMRFCMWLSLVGVPLSIGTCALSKQFKLDWVASSSSRYYVGDGYLCWWGYAARTAPGLYVRGPGYGVGMVYGFWWHGIDRFDVEYIEIWLGWLVVALMATSGAAAWTDRLLKRALTRASRCSTCGYDLTGNVSGRCPECGTEIKQRATPPSGRAASNGPPANDG